jgi:hypothetical protein
MSPLFLTPPNKAKKKGARLSVIQFAHFGIIVTTIIAVFIGTVACFQNSCSVELLHSPSPLINAVD